MLAVPSLVGTGTALAAATAGLAIGQPLESNFPDPSRPSSPFTRKRISDFSFDSSRATPTPPLSSRPGTSSALTPSQPADGYPSLNQDQPHPSPLFSHPINSPRQPPASAKKIAPPRLDSRRHSYIRQGDVATTNNTDGSARDSFSSHGSWMRRLSLRPTSQHESPRSSIGPDSSFTFSEGSGASLLSPTSSTAAPPPPNRLIKRVSINNESIFARRGSKGQLSSLRRPATSHQRSATALQTPITPAPNTAALDKISHDQSPRPRASTAGQANLPWRLPSPPNWTSFFHKKRVRTSRRGNLAAPAAEGNSADRPLPGTRIHIRRGSLPRPFLIHPQMLSGQNFEVVEIEPEPERALASETASPVDSKHASSEQSDDTPTKKARRSLSTNFGPPSAWKNRASSLRRAKRSLEEHRNSRRYASDPTSSASSSASRNPTPSDGARLGIDELFTPPKSANRDARKLDIFASQPHGPNFSSSLPATSRLSGLHMDTSRAGPSPPSSAGLQAASPTQLGSAAAPYGASLPSHSRAVSKEGASTLAGSEMSAPGLLSGDDDTDYKSDAPFDSFRTNDTNRLETPIDTMFDEPFPGNIKTKRLSIQEILGASWDGETRIVEEDEGSSTPMRGFRKPRTTDDSRDAEDRATEIARYQLSMGDPVGRLSLDTTDDDYDWARDDDVVNNPLSPPTNSLNSRRGPSPPLRSALASISGNSGSDSYTISPTAISPVDRPRSNLFDWSEPSHEKSDEALARPKTAHSKQDIDPRGGRSSNRKGVPTPHHIRSQSVPVVPELQDSSKGAPKFGTWAVGNMNPSEDWDDDFDFEEASNAGSVSGSGSGPRNAPKSLLTRLPESVQATQPTVKAHSGQIRELSLLVSNLKRLVRQGRELNLMDGHAAPLWKEAENIISLASPDEEEVDDSTSDQSFSDFDPSTIDERFLDEGFDASTLDRSEHSFESDREPPIPKNAVVRERQVVRRRSVFSPEDDIFGNNRFLEPPSTRPPTPRTPERVREFHTPEGTVVSSVIAAMEQQRSLPKRSQESPLKPSKAKLFFDTNSLQELVKRASSVYHTLSDLVCREEHLTMSPQATPRHDRSRRGGSPAFTRVFSDPDASSPRHIVKSQKSQSSIPRRSIDSNGLGQRIQMMTVS